MTKRTVLLFLAAAATGLGMAPSARAGELWTVSGLEQPESALVDADRSRIVVSNIAGHPGEEDGRGFLSLVSLSGEMIERRWVTGLDAPKGMAILGTDLLVADLGKLRIVDLQTGALRSVEAAGATFLNDIAVLDGRAFVTDLVEHVVYVWDGSEIEPWLASADLRHPNGIAAVDGQLVVASWGPGMKADFTTESPGGLLRIDPADKSLTRLGPDAGIGNLDGVAEVGGSVITNDWFTGEVFALRPDGALARVAELPPGLADIGVGAGLLLAPLMHDGELRALDATALD